MKIPDGWKQTVIGELSEFRNGNGFKPEEWKESGLPIIRIQNLNGSQNFNYYQGAVKEGWIVNHGDLLYAWAGVKGVSFGPTIWRGKQGVLNQHIFSVSTKRCDKIWLYYALVQVTRRIETKAHGFKSSLLHVHKSEITDAEVGVPPLLEQKAIANTLSTWDAAIEKTERLIAAKEKSLAGRYQRDFSEEGIRSNGWSRVPLCELFAEVTRSVEGKSLKPYSISAGKGFVSQEEKFGRDISGTQYQNYVHLKPGEFAYNKGNSKRFQQGCIYLLADEEIAVPNAFISFGPKSEKVVTAFYKHYFLGNRHARELRKCISSGARGDGLLNVNTDDFFQIKVPHPPIQEQKALAQAFDILVTEIALMRQKLELLKLQKRGLMQKLLASVWRVETQKNE
jgi:type I restriction enzyme, S subunit